MSISKKAMWERALETTQGDRAVTTCREQKGSAKERSKLHPVPTSCFWVVEGNRHLLQKAARWLQ